MAGLPGAVTFDDARLTLRQVKSQEAFYRALAGGSPGARLIHLPGVEALVVPACPWLSFVNSVFFYESATTLAEAIPELEAEYARAGVASWRALVPDHDRACADLLDRAGFVCTAVSLRQAAVLANQDLEPDGPLDLVTRPTWELVARCNDYAYGTPEALTTAAAFVTMDDPASHLYAALVHGEVVSGLVAREQDDHCYLNLVATIPRFQRKGIGRELVRVAKRAAMSRGCEISSGETTLVTTWRSGCGRPSMRTGRPKASSQELHNFSPSVGQ